MDMESIEGIFSLSDSYVHDFFHCASATGTAGLILSEYTGGLSKNPAGLIRFAG
jgi:hypothetical protein